MLYATRLVRILKQKRIGSNKKISDAKRALATVLKCEATTKKGTAEQQRELKVETVNVAEAAAEMVQAARQAVLKLECSIGKVREMNTIYADFVVEWKAKIVEMARLWSEKESTAILQLLDEEIESTTILAKLQEDKHYATKEAARVDEEAVRIFRMCYSYARLDDPRCMTDSEIGSTRYQIEKLAKEVFPGRDLTVSKVKCVRLLLFFLSISMTRTLNRKL